MVSVGRHWHRCWRAGSAGELASAGKRRQALAAMAWSWILNQIVVRFQTPKESKMLCLEINYFNWRKYGLNDGPNNNKIKSFTIKYWTVYWLLSGYIFRYWIQIMDSCVSECYWIHMQCDPIRTSSILPTYWHLLVYVYCSWYEFWYVLNTILCPVWTQYIMIRTMACNEFNLCMYNDSVRINCWYIQLKTNTALNSVYSNFSPDTGPYEANALFF